MQIATNLSMNLANEVKQNEEHRKKKQYLCKFKAFVAGFLNVSAALQMQMPALSTGECGVSQVCVSHQVVPRCGTAAQHTPGQDTGHTKSQYRHTLVTLLSHSAGYVLGVGVGVISHIT